MPGLGWTNPIPCELGGGRSKVELIYRAMRSVVGVGGAGPEDGLEDLSRQARAYGIAAAFGADERAALQFFPDRATDALPYYEQLLLAPLPPGLADHEKQAALAERFTAPPAASHDETLQGLESIDARFELVTLPHDQTEVTVPGRAFEDLAASEPFGGGRKSTVAPNFSTDFLVVMLLDLQGAAPVTTDLDALERGRNYLSTALPAWVFFAQATALGFILDTDRLDLTGLT